VGAVRLRIGWPKECHNARPNSIRDVCIEPESLAITTAQRAAKAMNDPSIRARE
jgi:hypothetical protein